MFTATRVYYLAGDFMPAANEMFQGLVPNMASESDGTYSDHESDMLVIHC